MAYKLGLDAQLFHGAAGSTATSEMKNCKDVTLNPETGEADITTRAAEGWRDALAGAEAYFQRLASVSTMEILDAGVKPEGKLVSAVCEAGELFIPLGDLVDLALEKARLEKERKNLEGEIARSEGKLGNAGFTAKAPAALVEAERAKLEKNRQMLGTLIRRIAEMD